MNKITFTAQEKYAITAHMLSNVTPKDHEEGIKFYDLFQECGLTDSKKIFTSKDASKMTIDDFDSVKSLEESVSNSTINYLLEVLNKPMNGLLTLILVPVSMRLRKAQADQYAKKE